MKLSGWIYSISSWIMRLSLVNLVWFILNIPFWFTLWSWFISDQKFSIYHFGLFLVIFPFVFIPTTAAMFNIVREWIIQEIESSVVRYIKILKQTYKENLKIGFLFGFVWIIWIFDVWFFYESSEILFIAFLVVGIILYVYQIIFFCMKSHFDMNQKKLLTTTFHTVFGRPVLSILLLLSSALVIFIVIYQVPFILPFFSGVIVAFLSFLLFHHFMNAIRLKASDHDED